MSTQDGHRTRRTDLARVFSDLAQRMMPMGAAMTAGLDGATLPLAIRAEKVYGPSEPASLRRRGTPFRLRG